MMRFWDMAPSRTAIGKLGDLSIEKRMLPVLCYTVAKFVGSIAPP